MKTILSNDENCRAALLLAQPNLAATEQGKANKAAHLEFTAAVDNFHLSAVDRASLGIEYLSCLVFVALLFETPHKRHAQHRLIAPRAGTLLALRRRIVAWRGEDFFDLALILAVDLANPNQALGLAGMLVEGFPQARWR